MTYEDRLAYVGYINMIDLNRCNGSDYNGLKLQRTFLRFCFRSDYLISMNYRQREKERKNESE